MSLRGEGAVRAARRGGKIQQIPCLRQPLQPRREARQRLPQPGPVQQGHGSGLPSVRRPETWRKPPACCPFPGCRRKAGGLRHGRFAPRTRVFHEKLSIRVADRVAEALFRECNPHFLARPCSKSSEERGSGKERHVAGGICESRMAGRLRCAPAPGAGGWSAEAKTMVFSKNRPWTRIPKSIRTAARGSRSLSQASFGR